MSIYRVPDQVPCWWEAGLGKWVVSLPPNYPRVALTKLRDWLLNVQKQRRLDPRLSSEEKEDLDKSVQALKDMKFIYKAQHDSYGRGILYEQSQKERPDRTFSFGGNNG